MARWQSANLLHATAAGRRLWQLSASGDGFSVQSEKALLSTDPLPGGLVGKDWHTLFRAKLNVAWLPADKVFLRAVHLPASERADIMQMVELQMEKLSPLPVTHVVWSVYMMPRPEGKPDALQTVIVIIAARSAVEEFLGRLEAQGFMADRLEAPGLDQLLLVDINEEGVWIVPGAPGEPALVAWWYGGAIQNLTLVTLPPGEERGPQLRTQIEQIAWAGELEGWLTSAPKIHLVANSQEARFWEPVFRDSGEELNVIAPPGEAKLVARSIQRSAQDSSTNLLPPEFSKRYRQQFVDGLWMRGIFAVLGLYVVGVLIYFGALYALKMKFDHVKHDLASIGNSYTNAIKDIKQLDILRERSDLKFLALDCWKAVAEHLPETGTIDDFYFERQKLELRGTITSEDQEALFNFNEELRHIPNTNKPGQLLFSEVSSPPIRVNGDKVEWRFTCQLNASPNE
ncbi:MAG TPA: hypothetical protein VGO59_08315 [Verrucomicrobiae bacterium]|jgi:hypothetical protein